MIAGLSALIQVKNPGGRRIGGHDPVAEKTDDRRDNLLPRGQRNAETSSIAESALQLAAMDSATCVTWSSCGLRRRR